MARNTRTKRTQTNEEIHIDVFKNISIHFPGDVYLLAIWVAMSDRAQSTPTCESHTSLQGLANKFELLYGINYSDPLSSDDVMAVFRSYGINGNPLLRMDIGNEHPSPTLLFEGGNIRFAESRVTEKPIAEQ